MGFIFKHAESLEVVTRTDDDLGDETSEVVLRSKGYDGMRSKVSFNGNDYEKAAFSVTDLWIDSETIPDLWNKGVLSDHLNSDPLAHDWMIIKEDSYISCNKENCQINVHFKRDFDTNDLRDHKITDGEEQDFQFVAFYNTFTRGKTMQPVHRGISQPITIAL